MLQSKQKALKFHFSHKKPLIITNDDDDKLLKRVITQNELFSFQ